MSVRSFRSVFMVASCAGAALGCYLVSLRVASERAAVETVETKIVLTQRDIRLLQTEIGTRGRLAQLERWNAKVLALSAPSADQFLDGGFALAKMVAPQHQSEIAAPVVLASQSADAPRPHVEGAEEQSSTDEPAPGVSAKQMLHTASLTRELESASPAAAVASAKPKPVKLAQAEPPAHGDPLAPRPVKSAAHAKAAAPATTKDAGSKQ